jgi:hypothetical protein
MATCGANLNKDFFAPQELFNAIKTPLFKPVDWEHHGDEEDDESEIIGTITAAWFEDLDGKKVEAESFKDMPAEFNVVTSAVIWKYLYAKRSKTIEERYENEELYCSLECWFSDYDYAVREDSSYKIVKRNKTTAVLDKHLLQKGGTGKINGKSLYRVPRNITFGGLGIVKKPANKKSVVKDLVASENKVVLPVELKRRPDGTRVLEKLLLY